MIDINLITDKEIKSLNKKWFGRSYATDVIAFGYKNRIDGEVFVSIETAKRQAKERSVTLQDEILRLIIHGVTHVEGYDDLNTKDFKKMREREWKILLKCL